MNIPGKTKRHGTFAVRDGTGCAVLWLALATSVVAQYDVPSLENGFPNPYCPTVSNDWNATAAFTPGGGATEVREEGEERFTVFQGKVGTHIVGLSSQYGIGDELPRPEGVPLDAWPDIATNQGMPECVEWLEFENTNLLVAVDEGVAYVQWKVGEKPVGVATGGPQAYVIGPNLTRRPVRLFWTEGQYAGPRVRFGNNYEVKIWYNSQLTDPADNPTNLEHIALERIDEVAPETIFLKNSELRACAGARGRVLITYSRRPEGPPGVRELLTYEVVDVLEPMSSTLKAHVADRLLPKRRDYDTDKLFCDVTRGGVDASGIRPEDVLVYQHQVGRRKGWVWAVRPTDSPWQIEVFWKAKEELDVIWPFEVDIYDVSWNPDSQRCALGVAARGGAAAGAYFPQTITAEVMPYQAVPMASGNGRFVQVSSPIAGVDDRVFRATAPGMCTMKYTYGEDVWFESIRTAWETDLLVYQGVTNWSIGSELRPFAQETVAGAEYADWPGFLRVPPDGTTVLGDTKWDRYHAELYRYPSAYPVNEDMWRSQILAVNLGHLGAWWWNPSEVSITEDMPAPLYWPSLVCDYNNVWPQYTREIVIASFRGSTTDTWIPDETGSLDLPGAGDLEAVLGIHPAYTSEWEGVTYDEGFLFETWIRPDDVDGRRGIMNMPIGVGTNLTLFLENGTPAVSVVRLIESTPGYWEPATQSWYASDAIWSNEWSHVALSYAGSTLQLYVDGLPAGDIPDAVDGLAAVVLDGLQLGSLRTWTAGATPTPASYGYFAGRLDEIRLWWGPRTAAEVYDNHGLPLEATERLRCRFEFDPAAPPDPALPAGTYPDAFGYMIVTLAGGASIDAAYTAPKKFPGRAYPVEAPEVYVQNDSSLTGYNPNEEHGILVGGVMYALRSDLNQWNTSEPYALVEYSPVSGGWRRGLDVYHVVPTNSHYPRFEWDMEAGKMIQPPPPLRYMLPDNLDGTHPDQGDEALIFRDRRRYYWAKQAADNGGALEIGMRFYYPMQNGFWFPSLSTQPAPTTEVPWLSGLASKPAGWELDGAPVRVAFGIVWPQIVPTLNICDTLTLPKNGLPAVRGQKSVNIPYQQSVALAQNPDKASVLLIDPTAARKVELEKVPPKMRAMRDPRTGYTFFSDLDPDLRERLFYVPYEPATERLWLKGMFVEYPSYHYLRLNLMTPDLIELATNPVRMVGIDQDWIDAVNDLPTSRIEKPSEHEPFDSLALVTPGFGAGYVTLVFNNSTNINMVDTGDPVSMQVIRIDTDLFGGRIDIIESSNPLDQYMTLRHISDFAGEPERWSFEWKYAEPDAGAWPTNEQSWLALVDDKEGRYTTIFGSSGAFGLGDAWVKCRYRAQDPQLWPVVGTNWSAWTAPVLCEGWIKRVLKAINPFDQRIRDYMNYALNTELSMIQQAGQPYAGDVPLNMDALNEYGLIPIYQTVLEHSRDLTLDNTLGTYAETDVICLALMLAAGRLNDLYMVLGNEAYADAMNPTLSLGNDDPVLAGEATSIFAFQNIVATLLDEELALLRGRDVSSGRELPLPTLYPIHNRLPWNFTADITHGQVAYVLNYGISDLKGDQDGVVDADDAAALFPQGHGDAWGHYLAAVKSYYYLFRHRSFTWFPQLEGIRVGQVETTMSALHEKKFAGAAAAKARAGLAIVDRTYRLNYEEGAEETWTVQRDSRTNRVWGVGEWGGRVSMGCYLDWVMANALLPDEMVETNGYINPLAVIARETVPELTELVLAAGDVQEAVDMADRGMNPLGVGPGAVPFDISPSEIDEGNTHFEQAYEKALRALSVARAVYERVHTATAAIRDQNEERDFDTVVLQQEQAYDRRLIDIYGFPYMDDMGPGKLYPEDYVGPDTKHYFYINRYDYFGKVRLDADYLESQVVIPTLMSSGGVRDYKPGELAPRPPDSDPTLTLDAVLQFVDPTFMTRYQELKKKYTTIDGEITREKVEELGIAELTALYNEVMGAYNDIETALFEAAEDVVAWFDGVIGAPVDAIDDFISQWVRPGVELEPLETVTGPNIAYTTNHVRFWVGPEGLPMKPETYTSNRRAEGEIQIALGQYILALREASQAIEHSQTLYQKIFAADGAFRNQIGSELMAYYNEVNALNDQNSLEQIIEIVDKAIALVEKVYTDGENVYEAIVAAIPKIAGMSMDIGAAVEGVVAAARSAATMATTIQKLANSEQVTESERDIEIGKRILELNDSATAIQQHSREMAKRVVDAALEYLASLDALDVALQKAETFRMQYSRAIASGDMIQVEREQARSIWATDLSGRRYRNMAYHIIRNDELARYDQAAAMAARYVYLAAKAYDYETGLLRHDGAVGASGREFLSQIVRARALGRFDENGNPLPGGPSGDPGLADIMARMAANWSVLDGRLNFNNPQTETGMFSLRRELFRIPESAAFDDVWRRTLEEHWVDDVLDLVEFRVYCLPFTPSQTTEPAIVIPFSSTIDFRRNFFDKPLGAGDNAYDSTHFSTKVRSVGVWFANYRKATLANQPRVYLVPVGEDRMRVPDGIGETVRSWTVLDQALPIPYPLSNESWMHADWHVNTDVLGGDFFTRRRFASLRAYHDDGFDVSQMSANSRLIGRSVWNTRWLLVIPGGTLLADAERGLKQFINGRELAPGCGTYDGEGVKDIRLFFQTYSYSGN